MKRERTYSPAEARAAMASGRLPPEPGEKPKAQRQRMNKTERAFQLQVLEPWQRTGIGPERFGHARLLAFGFERMTVKLADDCRYTPDFYLVLEDTRGLSLVYVEVKGYWEEDARVKIRVAADRFPHFGFVAVTWENRREWRYESFRPSPESGQ